MLPEPATIARKSSIEWLEESSLSLLKQSLSAKSVTGRTAVVSSFGAESAVLLHLVARVNRDAPILFIDTFMMFQETLDYQKRLASRLGLTNVQVISASTANVQKNDASGQLHSENSDACCHLRKTLPLEKALKGFNAWINGRKRHHSSSRAAIKPMEADENGRIKINPLFHWGVEDVEAYFKIHNLPRHPLVSQGYTSIGCAPCTVKTKPGDDPRSGRWAGQEKTECGIHFENGKIIRRTA